LDFYFLLPRSFLPSSAYLVSPFFSRFAERSFRILQCELLSTNTFRLPACVPLGDVCSFFFVSFFFSFPILFPKGCILLQRYVSFERPFFFPKAHFFFSARVFHCFLALLFQGFYVVGNSTPFFGLAPRLYCRCPNLGPLTHFLFTWPCSTLCENKHAFIYGRTFITYRSDLTPFLF